MFRFGRQEPSQLDSEAHRHASEINRAADLEKENLAPKWAEDFAEHSKHSVGDKGVCGRKAWLEEEKFMFQPPDKEEEVLTVLDGNDSEDSSLQLPRQQPPPAPVKTKRMIHRCCQMKGRVLEYQQEMGGNRGRARRRRYH